MKKDFDKQLVEMLQHVKDLAAEIDLLKKELEELKVTAQAVVDMVEPTEEDTGTPGTPLECLQRAPQGIVKYLSNTTRQ